MKGTETPTEPEERTIPSQVGNPRATETALLTSDDSMVLL